MLPMSEIHALIKLLDDSNQEIYSQVTRELIDCGVKVIPTLEHAVGRVLRTIVTKET